MSSPVNLAAKIEKSLPPQMVELIKKTAALAENAGLEIFLVGGVVRDLLLARPNFDLDLVVNGDAIKIAGQLARDAGGKVTRHPMFTTAKVKIGEWIVDLAMLRRETYAKPGALPSVSPGTLQTDLFRRDFTVNAMAVRLNTDKYGELVDMFGGMKDLERQLIRVLHEKSFTDDATRIWRAIRYEQRLGFQIEPKTLALLQRDIAMLSTVGGYRLRRELELVLNEKEPEKALARADALGVLAKLHPALKFDNRLAQQFKQARISKTLSTEDNLSLLTSRLNDKQFSELAAYLRLPRSMIEKIRRVTLG